MNLSVQKDTWWFFSLWVLNVDLARGPSQQKNSSVTKQILLLLSLDAGYW